MIEITIVSTALFKVSDALLALNKSQWVIVSYLLTFTGKLPRHLLSSSPATNMVPSFSINCCTPIRCYWAEIHVRTGKCDISCVFTGLWIRSDDGPTVSLHLTLALSFSLFLPFLTLSSIIFRALQGVGGAAVNSLVFNVMMTLLTSEQVGFYTGIVGSVSALSNFLGPVLGGIVTDHASWRWIFYLKLVLPIFMPKIS